MRMDYGQLIAKSVTHVTFEKGMRGRSETEEYVAMWHMGAVCLCVNKHTISKKSFASMYRCQFLYPKKSWCAVQH